METPWLPASLVGWITGLPGTLDARQQARFVRSVLGCASPAAVAPSPVGCGPAAWGAITSAVTTCWAAWAARPQRSPGPCFASSLHRLPPGPEGTLLVFALDDSTTQRYGSHVEGADKHYNPTPGRGRPGPNSSTATSGSAWPGWSDIRTGTRSPCPSSCKRTSGPTTSAGWRPSTAGSFAPSWNWPPRRSSGWSSSCGTTTHRSGWSGRSV
jgi:hypothetical protein